VQGGLGPTGPQGVQGPNGADGTGVNILGTYNSYTELVTNHPTGNPGDAYLIQGDLWVWSANTNTWNNAGHIQGPQGIQGIQGVPGSPGAIGSQGVQGIQGNQGPQGEKGPTGSAGPQGLQGIQGPQGDTGAIGPEGPQGPPGIQGIPGVQGSQGIQGPQGDAGATGPVGTTGPTGETGPQGPQGIQGETGPQGDTGTPGTTTGTIIPFATQNGVTIGTDTNGQAREVTLISFISTVSPTVIITGGNIVLGSFDQNSFSLPYDCIIENIYATICSMSSYTLPSGVTTYPYIQLYSSTPESNIFAPIPQSRAMVTQGYSGSVPAETVRFASSTTPSSVFPAGTRILIIGEMLNTGPAGALERSGNFNFTGGIGVRAATL
jgi:hypothetical protein